MCLDRFIETAKKQPDILLTEGSMLGRTDEQILTESELEDAVVERMKGLNSPLLFQCSSQNIDRLVSFYRAALRLKRTLVVDIYTANVLYELRQLGNNLPYPSNDYPDIKVFFPYRLTQKIFNEIGEEYARRFSAYHISREQIKKEQNGMVMACLNTFVISAILVAIALFCVFMRVPWYISACIIFIAAGIMVFSIITLEVYFRRGILQSRGICLFKLL